MADLPTLLLASLAPDTRKQAEQALSSLADQPGFVEAVLRLVLDQNGDKGARLAGSVYLKNVAKRKWDDDAVEPSQQISPTDKAGLRQALVPAMIALSTPANKALRAQIAETVAVVARKDFPGEWGDLIDQLVNSLSPTEYNINLGVLETAHSIFSPWRSQVRSDALFTTINFVLGRFVDPYLALLRQTSNLLLGGDARAEVAGTMRVLVDLYHDLTCQDLPPAIEDSHLEFWGVDAAQGQQGVFLRFLEWDPVALRGDEDDATPSIPSLIKAGILEVAEMYTKLYPEMVSKSPTVEAIIRAVWALVGAGRLQGVAYDGLVTQALRFISSTIRSGHYKTLFSSPETISGLGEGVVVPNVMLREHDIEQFEDDPLEYVRLDLSATSGLTDSSTRRQAAADVLRALVAAGFEAETTRLAQGWVAQGLESYKVDRENGWRAKDSAVFVLSAVAVRGGTAQAGVTSTNALIDIIDFFSNHVFGDLQPATPPAHPILAADAIRFLYTFRNQLTKEQLLSVLPLLVHHLGNLSYVVYTYAAVCIERILFIKQGGKLLFTQADVHDFAQGLLDALLSKIEAGGSAEKIAENDYLMKSAMRVILTARQTLTPGHAATLQRLVNILGVTAKNPSNPNFDQYLFESIAALIRFVVAGSPNTLPGFEQALFGPFTFIIQQEVEQYIPYAFQILAQMLALHPANGGVPDAYKSLLPFLLVPGPWEQKGSVPGLVALLRAYLAADARAMVAAGQHVNVLAIVQQRLIRSRINDAWGFELLRSVVQYVPSDAIRPQLRAVLITLLTRMQESKTDGYVAGFAHFILFAMALDGPGIITPDVWITESEGVQGGLWTTLLNTFVIPQVPKFQPRDRKMAAVGLTRMLSTPQMLQSAAPAWPPAFTALVQLFSQPQLLASAQSKTATEDEGGVSAIDVEEQAAGYQAAYSRLVAAEPVREDVVAYVPDPQAYVVQRFREASAASGGTLGQAVAAADQSVVGGFVGVLRGAGVQV